MSVKRITIRVSPELHAQLTQVAAERHTSLNQLAIEALEAYVLNRAAEQGKLPLRELSALLAPAAEAKGLTEEELLRHAREVRRRIWQERYQRATQAVADPQPS